MMEACPLTVVQLQVMEACPLTALQPQVMEACPLTSLQLQMMEFLIGKKVRHSMSQTRQSS